MFFICPQECGYASDPTHARFTDGEALTSLARRVGLAPQPWSSFPFPREVGKVFTYYELNLIAVKPGTAA